MCACNDSQVDILTPLLYTFTLLIGAYVGIQYARYEHKSKTEQLHSSYHKSHAPFTLCITYML